MFEVPNLEIHAWHGCNLFCESCSHYSSLGARRGPTLEQCRLWMEAWASRLKPRFFSVLGGEPTLHPQLTEIVRSAGSIWPHSRIRVVTNGFRLDRHPELPEAMAEIRDRCVLDVSSHHNDEDYQRKFEPVRELCKDWKERYKLDIRITPAERRWSRRYNYSKGKIEFLDGEPRAAWEACEGKKCKQIYDGKLWKCAPIAYFGLAAERNYIDERWHRLAESYVALDADCSDDVLAAFVAKEHEEICRLCPSHLERFDLPNPMIAIRRK